MRACVCVRTCVRVHARTCVCECLHACLYEREREREREKRSDGTRDVISGQSFFGFFFSSLQSGQSVSLFSAAVLVPLLASTLSVRSSQSGFPPIGCGGSLGRSAIGWPSMRVQDGVKEGRCRKTVSFLFHFRFF